jgi:phosphate transport system substrate-binding protein
MKHKSIGVLAGVLFLGLTACGGGETETAASSSRSPSTVSPTATPAEIAEEEARNTVLVDGSSVVFPLSEALAQSFTSKNPGTRVVVGISHSGGGFKRFCIGDTDLVNASRPITEVEMKLCKKNGVEYVEVPIAYDGIVVVANRYNDWVECLTLEELGKIWSAESQGKFTEWKQVREEFPDVPLKLYGPDTESGTYDYFTAAVTGTEGKSRTDFGASEHDDVIAQGIDAEWGGLGFVSFNYYNKKKDALKLVQIDNGGGECIEPNPKTIGNGTYSPLARPLFVYVNNNSLKRIEVVENFVNYQIDVSNQERLTEAGYVPIPESILVEFRERIEKGDTGSIFDGGSAVGVKLAEKLSEENEK